MKQNEEQFYSKGCPLTSRAQPQGTTGFGLVQLVVTLAISSMLVLGASRVYDGMTSWKKREGDRNGASAIAKELGLHFKLRFSGTYSFQNINLKLPNTGNPGFRSIGPGIYIDPDKNMSDGIPLDSGGNKLKADVLYLVSRAPASTPLPFQSDLAETAIEASKAHFFQVGEYYAISNIQKTDLFALKTENVAGIGAIPFPDLKSSSSPHFLNAEGLDIFEANSNRYKKGDPIFKASIVKIGLDSLNGQLISRALNTGVETVLGRGISQFSISNRSAPSSDSTCNIDTHGDFSRDNWSTLNSDSACYKNLNSIRISLTIDPMPEFNYEFLVN